MSTPAGNREGVGSSPRRKEDKRFLRGRGRYVADLRLRGLQDVAFVRSRKAHARILAVEKPKDEERNVFVADDLVGVRPIVTPANTIVGSQVSAYPILAGNKVRFFGEPIAACLAASRAQAEDLAERIVVAYEDVPAVVDATKASEATSGFVHDDWKTNVIAEFNTSKNFDGARSGTTKVTREFRLGRQAMVPMEGLAVVAEWDERLNQLQIHTSTQIPHIVRMVVAESLSLPQASIRVISPDVGGGFGYKSVVHPEEVLVAWLAYHRRHPVRWIEDRYEHLTAASNTREQRYKVAIESDGDGRILALDVDILVDAGAYSAYPMSNWLDAGQAFGIMPGPYDLTAYRARARSIATNKPPITPYRGVARPAACLALEMTIDALARALGKSPVEVRLANLVQASQMPYKSLTGKLFDSGDYPEALRRAWALISASNAQVASTREPPMAEVYGIGVACQNKQTAVGPNAAAASGQPLIVGHEQVQVRLTPDGGLEIRTGMHSHGQGMETTLAQVAHDVLGIPISRISVLHGDTAITPFSTGTYASRGIVMGGGAVHNATMRLRQRLAIAGAKLLQTKPDQVTVADGSIRSLSAQISIAEVAEIWFKRPHELTPDVPPEGFEATFGYNADSEQGAFSYGTHAASVAVNLQTGIVRVVDYVVVEDCGTMVHPKIVEGQTVGGVVQGIGTALYEETAYSEIGEPLATGFDNYHLPTAADVPTIRVAHLVSPSPFTALGIKGMGESGCIPSTAAIGNAINDALRPIGAEILQTPFSPSRVLAAIRAAQPVAQGAP